MNAGQGHVGHDWRLQRGFIEDGRTWIVVECSCNYVTTPTQSPSAAQRLYLKHCGRWPSR